MTPPPEPGTAPGPVPEVPPATDRDVFLTRVFAAPRAIVWRFFSDPALLGWFGPHGVHVDPDSVEIDLRPGGAWNLDMVDDLTSERYPMRATLSAVAPPEYLEGRAEIPGGEAVTLRIWLHDHGDRTRLTLHQGPFSDQHRRMTASGWEGSFEKIDAMIAELESGSAR